jgi:hypothetical protein
VSDSTKNVPWRVVQRVEGMTWVVEDVVGNFVFASPSEALARMVAAGSVAGELYAALKVSNAWLPLGLTFQDSTSVIEANKKLISSAAPLLEPPEEKQ